MTKKKKIIIISIILTTLILIGAVISIIYVISDKNKKEEWELIVKRYRQTKIEKYIQENNQYDDYEIDIAFLGDSLTDRYNVSNYYSLYKVVNRGISGDTTFDLEERLQVSVYDLKPKIAIMLIGANNLKTMFDNYERIVTGLKNNLPNTKIILLSLTSMSGDWGKNNELACFNNVKIKLIAEKYNCTYIDLFTPLFDFDTNGIFDKYTTDGGHLTSQGYDVLTSVITPEVDKLLCEY